MASLSDLDRAGLGGAGRRSGSRLGDLRVGVKLGALAVISVIAIVVVGVVGIRALNAAAAGAANMQALNGYTRTTLEADMAHDAIRADVMRARLDPGGPDATAARSDFVEHSKILHDGVEMFRGPDQPADVRTAADQVAPAVQSYLTLADQTIAAAIGGQANPAMYPQFQAAFSAVEEQLPAVGDALQSRLDKETKAVAGQRTTAVTTVWLAALLCGLLLTLLS
jgi:methyl-accepting chemotaxis protein